MTPPLENLDDRTFEELVKEAVSRIPVYAPDWTDHNVHDPGITLIELFAWLAEMQIYRLNRISDKSYRKFLKLMGIPKLKPARAAEVDLSFSTRDQQPTLVPARTQVAAKDPISGEAIIFETKDDLNVVDAKLGKILSRPKSGAFIDNSEANENENVYYYAFRDKPEVDDKLYLGFDKSLTDKEITLAFYLYEEDLPKICRYGEEKPYVYPSVTMNWEYYTGGAWEDDNNWKSFEIKDETGHLTVSGKIWIKIKEEMEQTVINNANLFWLRCRIVGAYLFGIEDGELEKELNTLIIPERLNKMFESKGIPLSGKTTLTKENEKKWVITDEEKKNVYFIGKEEGKLNIYVEAGYEMPPKIDNILLNAVSAIQSRTLKDCTFSSSGLPDFYLDLEYIQVIDTALSVNVKEDEWSEEDDFDASKSGDMHYTVDLATGRVTFGNGINAKIPPKGEDNITISYSSGGGVRGNVEPYAINRVLGELAADVTVENRNAAVGGEEAETLEEALIRARKDLKTVYRAVTSADYELLAMNTPELRVARAKAIPRYHPCQENKVPGIVTVIVVPLSQHDKPKPSVGFLKTVYTHLDKHRLLTTELFVIPPEYVEVSVDATVVIKQKYVKSKVEERVREKLENFLHPIRGGVDQKGWPFGRSVYISEIYEIIDRVEGVDYVKTVTLNKNGEKQEGDIKISAHDLVCSVTHEIIVIVFLFSIDEQLISEWDNNTISKGLREAFKTKKGIAISENASIVKVGDNKWKIIDGKVVYIITKENKKLNIYKGEIHE